MAREQPMKINFDNLFSEAPSPRQPVTLPASLAATPSPALPAESPLRHTASAHINALTQMIATKEQMQDFQPRRLSRTPPKPAPAVKHKFAISSYLEDNVIERLVSGSPSRFVADLEHSKVIRDTKPQKIKKKKPAESKVFDKLYYMSKVDDLRVKYLKDKDKAKNRATPNNNSQVRRSKRNSLTNQHYLRNYTSFEERVKEDIQNSKVRQHFLANNPQFAAGKTQKFFTPKIIPSKYSKKAKSRYRQLNSSRPKDEDNLTIIDRGSLNSSFASLDYSLELVNRIEEHFFSKMNYIFANEQEEWVEAKPQNIELLTQTEFKVLSGLIMSLEDEPIRTQDFEWKLREYYYNLPPNQRQQLRNHEAKNKKKHKGVRAQAKAPVKKAGQQPRNKEKAKAKQYAGEYSRRLVNYV